MSVVELATILTWSFESSTARLCIILAPCVGRLVASPIQYGHILACLFNMQLFCACRTTAKAHQVRSAATPMLFQVLTTKNGQ